MSITFDFFYSEFLFRLLLASLLGGIIGLERDIHGRAAGLRTHLLVSLGASAFTILSESISANAGTPGFPADPARIAAQVVSGIGFLGAGVIIKEGVNVRGLTTAASLWSVAAIGMASGSGHYEIAIYATGIGLVSLFILKFSEHLYAKDTYRALSIQTPIEFSASEIIAVVQGKHLKILTYEIEKDYDKGISLTYLSLRLRYRGSPDKLADSVIRSLEASSIKLNEVKWSRI